MGEALKNELLDGFTNSFKNSDLSDVTFVLKDASIPAHRYPLALRCKYFKSLLYCDDGRPRPQQEEIIDAPQKAFEILLKYLYSGTFSLERETIDDLADLLNISRSFGVKFIEESVENHLLARYDRNDVKSFLKIAFLYNIETLKEILWPDIEIAINGFQQLEIHPDIPLELVQRANRKVSEIELFKCLTPLSAWYGEEDKRIILSNIRFKYMTPEQIMDVVRPSEVLSDAEILEIQHEYRGTQTIYDKNLMAAAKLTKCDAKTTFWTKLFAPERFGRTIIIDLESFHVFNLIKFFIQTHLSYHIEVSKDNIEWIRIVDFSENECFGQQTLYFPTISARYIKIVRINGPDRFKGDSLEVLLVKKAPKSYAGCTTPETSLQTAFIKDGENWIVSGKTTELFDQSFLERALRTSYIASKVSKSQGNAIGIKFNQPVLMSSCRFRLWNYDSRIYDYTVESNATSSRTSNIETICTKTDVADGWQALKFKPRKVDHVLMRGTKCNVGDEFRVVYFEAPTGTTTLPKPMEKYREILKALKSLPGIRSVHFVYLVVLLVVVGFIYFS